MKNIELRNAIENLKVRSAWDKGVKEYAVEMLEYLEINNDMTDVTSENIKDNFLLNGASDWKQYSFGGSALIYDYEIAERLCTKSELVKCENGFKAPNKNETWLDVQTRALYQASRLIRQTYNNMEV